MGHETSISSYATLKIVTAHGECPPAMPHLADFLEASPPRLAESQTDLPFAEDHALPKTDI